MPAVDYTASIVMTGRYVGRCTAKGCRHTTTTEGPGAGECPDHGRYRLEHIVGSYRPEVKCGARCTNAVGPSCDCSCGGANHGSGH